MAVRECAWCGKEFTPGHYNQKYCCSDCSRLAQNRLKRERNRRIGAVPPYRKCRICGKTFEVDRYHRTYCSRECMEAGRRKLQREYCRTHREERRENARKWREKNIEKVRKYQKEYQRAYHTPSMDVPPRCKARGQTSCLTCTLEDCDG